jgi:hypothetical protein
MVRTQSKQIWRILVSCSVKREDRKIKLLVRKNSHQGKIKFHDVNKGQHLVTDNTTQQHIYVTE